MILTQIAILKWMQRKNSNMSLFRKTPKSQNPSYPQITVFSTSNCPYCQALMYWLDSKQIPYQLADASKSDKIKTAPTIIIGQTVIAGFNRPAIQTALKEYADAKN